MSFLGHPLCAMHSAWHITHIVSMNFSNVLVKLSEQSSEKLLQLFQGSISHDRQSWITKPKLVWLPSARSSSPSFTMSSPTPGLESCLKANSDVSLKPSRAGPPTSSDWLAKRGQSPEGLALWHLERWKRTWVGQIAHLV